MKLYISIILTQYLYIPINLLILINTNKKTEVKIMAIKEPAHIIISKLNKEKLDIFKLLKKESYNSVISELIRFGEENDFRNKRINNLNKGLNNDNINAKIKIKQRAITASTG